MVKGAVAPKTTNTKARVHVSVLRIAPADPEAAMRLVGIAGSRTCADASGAARGLEKETNGMDMDISHVVKTSGPPRLEHANILSS